MSLSAHPDDGLSAYLDGDLDGADARAVADHLTACADCRAVVNDLERLRTAARAWAADTATPGTDLWPEIAARLAPSEASSAGPTGTSSRVPVGRISWYRRRVSVGVPELAMAASLVAALGGAAIFQRAAAPAPPTGPAPIVAQVEPFDAPDAGVTTVSFADEQYDAAVNDLERVLREQRQHLNPRTVLVLERNLRIIDDAVGEARAALADDPANLLLNAQLADVRRRKLQLLRKAALITVGD
ncbi:MAG TPA: zf-HC2 domain-containing protein [Vicinamibacterales bacterium]|nr:zf-HC2 domain-containing protein [Vicinamibacterales bacterium]